MSDPSKLRINTGTLFFDNQWKAYIVTKEEKRILTGYLKNGDRTVGMRVLLHRTKAFLPKLRENLKLLEAVNKKREK
ncbi:MAG: hypothetical protein ABIH76_08920 [Candidatus Bathyarchaeota archaeon]